MNGHAPTRADDPPLAVQRSLIENEIAMWKNTRYQAQVRLRVQRKIEGEQAIIDGLISDLERCEKALDALAAELAALPAS